jgi:hypothetical protein
MGIVLLCPVIIVDADDHRDSDRHDSGGGDGGSGGIVIVIVIAAAGQRGGGGGGWQHKSRGGIRGTVRGRLAPSLPLCFLWNDIQQYTLL